MPCSLRRVIRLPVSVFRTLLLGPTKARVNWPSPGSALVRQIQSKTVSHSTKLDCSLKPIANRSLESTIRTAIDEYEGALVLTQVGSFYEVGEQLRPVSSQLDHA